jgi:S1-C subfamily serine protease
MTSFALRALLTVVLLALPTLAHAQARALAASASVTPSSTSEAATAVLAHVRPSVVQIRGFLGTNTAKAFHGTGFAIDTGGLFVTNYHVVSEKVQHPQRYRLEYRTPDGRSGPLTVRAVDVRHDLAIVAAEGHAPPPLSIAVKPMTKGDRAYAVGFPLDVGLTITEGISNGLVEDSFNPRIHYAGAVNGGMSGGPALNAAGDLIGVNVSGYIFQQLVSFLVPAAHILPLLDKARRVAGGADTLKDAVRDQMRTHAAELLNALAAPVATQKTFGYALPAKLAPFIDCNATGNVDASEPVHSVRISCSAKAGLYLQQGLYSGDIRFAHKVFSTAKLGAWRFTNRLSKQAAGGAGYGSKRHVAPYGCETRNVALKGFDARAQLCVRAYRKLDGLYDVSLRVVSLNGTATGFVSRLDMFGMEFDAGMSFARRYLAAMEWTP